MENQAHRRLGKKCAIQQIDKEGVMRIKSLRKELRTEKSTAVTRGCPRQIYEIF